GGVSVIAILINHFTGWPVGAMVWLMNVPILVLGFHHLGRWRFLGKTVYGVTVFSVASDLMLARMPHVMESFPVTQDVLLSAIYAGVIGGVGLGMVFGAGGSLGGTGVIGRILQNKWGVPLSSIYLYTDGGIIILAGILLGWEAGLFAMLTLFLNGVASDHVLEGPSAVRTATIITNEPEKVSAALSEQLGRGATFWTVTGSYTKQPRGMVLCTIGRPQVNELKRVVGEVDPVAFLTIGVSHQAYGGNFLPLEKSA
ncbi:MAG: YitT family protein, partial [Candidatus Eremiobacteraeota bacterium]|nr:YitT family protein [Candidatus Eremiobacteraeota bacterium]